MAARNLLWAQQQQGDGSEVKSSQAPSLSRCNDCQGSDSAPVLRDAISKVDNGDNNNSMKNIDLSTSGQVSSLQRRRRSSQLDANIIYPAIATSQRSNGSPLHSNMDCLDLKPNFVAQSSICWYALGLGLSMYIIDLILRRSRRSRSSIELLDVRTDREGNLIELILNNNHRRFSDWLPGQFVYLNCPQIAKFEWHPFTISSMDNSDMKFTLHIKTGGDWTRELRSKLELIKQSKWQHNLDLISISLCESDMRRGGRQGEHCVRSDLRDNTLSVSDERASPGPIVVAVPSQKQRQQALSAIELDHRCHLGADNKAISIQEHQLAINTAARYAVHCPPGVGVTSVALSQAPIPFDLFVDGPFHSPFDRLLEQQVSICISNGVGWTAFSSVFQCITERIDVALASSVYDCGDDWWSKWRRFSNVNWPRLEPSSERDTNKGDTNKADKHKEHLRHYLDWMRNSKRSIVDTKVHLMVIVTTIEQLRPFYDITLKYFDRLNRDYHIGVDDALNPVREVTAYLTRCKYF